MQADVTTPVGFHTKTGRLQMNGNLLIKALPKIPHLAILKGGGTKGIVLESALLTRRSPNLPQWEKFLLL